MKKILVVEDDKFLANAYRVKLTKGNYEVKIANDGEEAIKEINIFKPDLMILDLVMPKKDGFAVLEFLKGKTNIPIIVATNLGQKEDIDRAKTLGARDYIVKTELSMGDLVAKVASHL